MNREKPTEAEVLWAPGGTKVDVPLVPAACQAQDWSEARPAGPAEGLPVRVSSGLQRQSLTIEFGPDVSKSVRGVGRRRGS